MRHFLLTVVSWIIVLAGAAAAGYLMYRAQVEIVKTAIEETQK